MFRSAPVSLLRGGIVLGCPIYDKQNGKLLGEGIALTDQFIEGLKRRGIQSVVMNAEDLENLKGDPREELLDGGLVDDCERITECIGCRGPLALRPPRPTEQAANLECVRCGTSHYAVLDECCSPELRRCVRPGRFQMAEMTQLAAPPKAMEDFVATLTDNGG